MGMYSADRSGETERMRMCGSEVVSESGSLALETLAAEK